MKTRKERMWELGLCLCVEYTLPLLLFLRPQRHIYANKGTSRKTGIFSQFPVSKKRKRVRFQY
jgi:hypothetical protein